PAIRQSSIVLASWPVSHSSRVFSPVTAGCWSPPGTPPTRPVRSTPSIGPMMSARSPSTPTPPPAIAAPRPRRRVVLPEMSASGLNVMRKRYPDRLPDEGRLDSAVGCRGPDHWFPEPVERPAQPWVPEPVEGPTPDHWVPEPVEGPYPGASTS